MDSQYASGMHKKYPVILTDTERNRLQDLIATGTAPLVCCGRLASSSKPTRVPMDPLGSTLPLPTWLRSANRPTRVRKQFVAQGLDAALQRRAPRRQYQRKLDGAQEAHRIALACSEPPKGQARWSLRLLADKLVELEIVDEVSYQTVRRVLTTTPSNRG